MIFIILVIALVLFWINAEKVYESHKRTKSDHPFLFKITGFNEKYLDNREEWIKRFRVQMILIVAFFAVTLWVLTVISR